VDWARFSGIYREGSAVDMAANMAQRAVIELYGAYIRENGKEPEICFLRDGPYGIRSCGYKATFRCDSCLSRGILKADRW
jgi:hypothetical protein